MKGRTTRRIALAWWGSFSGGGPTAGDLLALQAAYSCIARLGFEASIICDAAFLRHVTPFAPTPYDLTVKYDAFIWVCGPLIGGSRQFRDLFNRFDGVPKIAVGVSVLPRDVADHFSGFDVCIARDGVAEVYGDLALAVPVSRLSAADHGNFRENRVALCLRGAQREYGLERCDHLRVEALCSRLVHSTGLAVTIVDTRLDRPGAAIELVERHFLTSRLVVSSRLHGALLAFRCGTPVLAIDQITGGGKVTEVLSRLRWPWVYRSDLVDPAHLECAAQTLVERGADERINVARTVAEVEAKTALRALTESLTRFLTP